MKLRTPRRYLVLETFQVYRLLSGLCNNMSLVLFVQKSKLLDFQIPQIQPLLPISPQIQLPRCRFFPRVLWERTQTSDKVLMTPSSKPQTTKSLGLEDLTT